MADHVYKTTELVGYSTSSIGRAAKTVRPMGCFEGVETRGRNENDRLAPGQVAVKIGCWLEDAS